MAQSGHFRVRGHCTFFWELRGERETRTLILDGRQCAACVEDLRAVAVLAGCVIADERGAETQTSTAEQASSPL